MKRVLMAIVIAGLLAGLTSGCANSEKKAETQGTNKSETKVVRLGFFPNITHSQALVGLSRGDFKRALGDVKLEEKAFNAGPSVIEAIFANELDISYIGPNPAINGYVKSKGKALKIIAGATSGGAVFVVREDAGINSDRDFAGKKFASPQLGNTQDVALRSYIKSKGYTLTEQGGSVAVVPVQNPDILTLFKKKELDGAWVPEPWGARLVQEANGKILLDERELWPNGEFVTAHIIVSSDFLEKNPELVKKFLGANVDITKWINDNPDEAKKVANAEIKRLTGKQLPAKVLDEGFGRLKVTYDPVSSSLFKSAEAAYGAGFLKEKPELGGIYDLAPLNEVLKEKGLKAVE